MNKIKDLEDKINAISNKCNKEIEEYSKRINNLYRTNKKSPLIERYRGQLKAYKDIKELMER